jgi:hypothetical protein
MNDDGNIGFESLLILSTSDEQRLRRMYYRDTSDGTVLDVKDRADYSINLKKYASMREFYVEISTKILRNAKWYRYVDVAPEEISKKIYSHANLIALRNKFNSANKLFVLRNNTLQFNEDNSNLPKHFKSEDVVFLEEGLQPDEVLIGYQGYETNIFKNCIYGLGIRYEKMDEEGSGGFANCLLDDEDIPKYVSVLKFKT